MEKGTMKELHVLAETKLQELRKNQEIQIADEVAKNFGTSNTSLECQKLNIFSIYRNKVLFPPSGLFPIYSGLFPLTLNLFRKKFRRMRGFGVD